MPEIVIVDDMGTEHVFPDGFDPRKAAETVRNQSITRQGSVTGAMSKASGIEADDSNALERFLQGASGVPGVIAGAAKRGLEGVAQLGDLARAGWNTVAPDDMQAARPYQQAGTMYEPSNPDQGLGQKGAKLAENLGVISGGASMLDAAPGVIARGLGISRVRAGQNIARATEAARHVPLDVEATGKAGLRAMELQQAGATMPRVASRFMSRITDPEAGPLTFGEARDYYSNLSRMSSNDYSRMAPTMQRQIQQMRAALHDALVQGADTVGEGQRYAGAIREYRRGSQAAEHGRKLLTRAGKATVGGAGGYIAIDYLLDRLKPWQGR